MSFSIAYKTVRSNEGGYRNLSYDAGGETYKGISRVYWPAWAGWKIIDEWKKIHTLKQGDVIPNAILDQLVLDFFQVNFWDKNKLGGIKNQSLQTLCLDMSINHGRGPKLINEACAKIKAGIPINSTVTTDSIAVMNANTQLAYGYISQARVAYVESLKSQLGPDYAGVLARAKGFLTKYSAEIATGAGVAIVVAALFFF
jgi:lysozyme family protein